MYNFGTRENLHPTKMSDDALLKELREIYD